jgi:CheY-like chemotaxis protein
MVGALMDSPPPIRTCVVADDDPAIRAFMTRVLLPERLEVFPAKNGKVAADLIVIHACDLLVTDLAMPGGEGIEPFARSETSIRR